MNENKSTPLKKTQNVRQFILLGILAIVLAAFLYDRYVLMPDATKKINEIIETVTLKLSEENREQVHAVIGRKPNSTFTHNGIEVEQYRFARGLPGFRRPVLDIAFEGNTLAFYRQEPIDTAYIESQKPVALIDDSLKQNPGTPEIHGFGGGPAKQPESPEE